MVTFRWPTAIVPFDAELSGAIEIEQLAYPLVSALRRLPEDDCPIDSLVPLSVAEPVAAHVTVPLRAAGPVGGEFPVE